MTSGLIELLVGLYFIGVSIGDFRITDRVKLVFGVILVVLALLQGVRII